MQQIKTVPVAAGFDIVHEFDASACAREVGLAMLADPARRVGLLIGNTRALWPHFSAARARLGDGPDPLQRYTEEVIDRVAAELPDARVLYAHRRYDGEFVPFQRLAVASGLGGLAPTQLVIHPVYGPWFALRAAILCAGEPVPAAVPQPPPCTCTASCHEALARAMASSGGDRPRAWLAVRDACSVGREHRYSDEQIEYHYSFLR